MKVAQEKYKRFAFRQRENKFYSDIFDFIIADVPDWMRHVKRILVFDSIAMRSIFNERIDKIAVNWLHHSERRFTVFAE